MQEFYWAKRILTESLASFDPEIYGLLQDEIQKQRFTLSLLPTSNAVSPFSAYLKGSILGNGHLDHHGVYSHLKLEEIAVKRAEKLFGAQHAIVRVADITAASRVVFHALLENGDTVLSFNRRKSEHCSGERMQFDFISFSIETDTEQVDLDWLEKLAQARKPRLIIFSPVNYPRNLDYGRLIGEFILSGGGEAAQRKAKTQLRAILITPLFQFCHRQNFLLAFQRGGRYARRLFWYSCPHLLRWGTFSCLVINKPLFSDEWLPQNINLTPGYGQKDLNIAREVEAEKKEAQMERMWSFWDN